MHKNPAVTLIMPVYNTENYLDEAVESVLTQTFSDWSMILIDDGSTDESGEICDRYAEQDSRIQVFHTEHQGYGYARNLGLLNASGDWIMFLDSDDYLSITALEHMIEQSDVADLVMALYQTIPQPSTAIHEIRSGRYRSLSDMGDDLTELYEPYFFLSVTAKLYRRSILGDGFIADKGPLISDWLFNFYLLPLCKGICFLPEVAYYYRTADHISTISHFHSEWLYTSKKVYEKVTELFPDHPQIIEFMSNRYACRVGEHMIAIALLHSANRLQKLAMIQAERNDPFYQQEAIQHAFSRKSTLSVWKAFMAADAQGTLEAAEKLIKETD